jgi:hypothetical protein
LEEWSVKVNEEFFKEPFLENSGSDIFFTSSHDSLSSNMEIDSFNGSTKKILSEE